MYQIWTQWNNPQQSYCDFTVWPYDLEHVLKLNVALGSDNFHQVWLSTTYPCLNYSILMPIRYVTVWPWPLTRWPWKYIKRHVIKVLRNWSEIEQYPAELLIILQIFARYVTLWPWPLTSWPWTLKYFGCRASKLCTKFERNVIIHGCVIGELARFRVQFWGWVTAERALSGVREPIHQTWRGHMAIIGALHFCFRIRISCCIFERGWLKV